MHLSSAGLTLHHRLTLVVGKGGVGKTTLACALAAHSARHGRRVLVVSSDPAHSLADCLGVPLENEPTSVADDFWALQIDPEHTLQAFLARTRSLLHAALDRGTYLDPDDIARLLNLPLPGIDEVTGLLELLRRLPDAGWQHLVLDTAPTGHTERLLRLPQALASFTALLDDLQERHRFMVARLARAYRPDDIDRFLWELQDQAAALQRTIRDPEQCGVILVGTVEPVVQAETQRYLDWLQQEELPLQALVLNQWERGRGGPFAHAVLSAAAPVPVRIIPRLRRPPTGLMRLRRFGALLARGWAQAGYIEPRGPQPASRERVAAQAAPPFATTPLQLFVGKGGVGKSTLASIEALALAADAGRVLLVSLDPAHSLSDIWAIQIGDATVQIADSLWAIEVDAAARWQALRDHWDDVLGATIDQGSTISGWQETLNDMRQVLDLMPPGVDEVIGLFRLAELWESGCYRTIVVDCAPTGHLLRLLALPELALEWVRMLMRLTLKYREVIGIGTLAEELIAMSKQLKATSSLLRDPARCAFIPITVTESLSIAETRRLVTALELAQMPIAAILLNRQLRRGSNNYTESEAQLAGLGEAERAYRLIEVPVYAGALVGRSALEAIVTQPQHSP